MRGGFIVARPRRLVFAGYSLQPPLCLGHGACSHQLVEAWHHSGTAPCLLLLRSLGLEQADQQRKGASFCAIFKGDVWLGRIGGALFVVGEECAPP